MLSQSDPLNSVRTWSRLASLVTIALERVEAGEFASVAAALRHEMPAVIVALRETITAPASTASQRLRAVELLMLMWSRCIRGDLAAQKVETMRLTKAAAANVAVTEKTKARAQERRATLEIAKHQQRIARKLKKLKEGVQNAEI